MKDRRAIEAEDLLAGAGVLRLVNTASRAELLRDVEDRLCRGEGFSIATLNLDHVVKLRRSDAFRAAYLRQSHVVADGNPIVWLSRLAGRKVDLVPGSELIEPLAALAARLDVPVAFLGSTEETLAAAAARLEAAHPGLRIVCRLAPPYGFDPAGAEVERYFAAIADADARLCFLALGAPKQEALADRGAARVPGCGFVSVGAGLDFLAGHQTRAPFWVRRIAMEWLWRMLIDPHRLAKRYWDCIMILPGLAWAARKDGAGR